MIVPFSLITLLSVIYSFLPPIWPGAVARSDASPSGMMQAAPGSISTSGTFGHQILSTDILSLALIQDGQLSVNSERLGIKYC